MRRNPGTLGPHSLAQVMRHALVPDPFTHGWLQWGLVAALHGSYSSDLTSPAGPGATTIDLAGAPSVNDFLVVAPYASTLAAAAAQGATTIEVGAAPLVGMSVVVGAGTQPLEVTGVSGTGPYLVSLASGLTAALGAGGAVSGSQPAAQVLAVSGSGPYTATVRPLQVGYTAPDGAAVTALKTLDAYLDGSNNHLLADGSPDPAFLTAGLRYLASYTPAVGDVVAVARGPGGLVSDRFVLCSLAS